jgi:hypothetical protein
MQGFSIRQIDGGLKDPISRQRYAWVGSGHGLTSLLSSQLAGGPTATGSFSMVA